MVPLFQSSMWSARMDTSHAAFLCALSSFIHGDAAVAWLKPLTLYSMYAFLYSARRKHDRRDEPSKSLSYVKQETFLFRCCCFLEIPSFKVYLSFSSCPCLPFREFFFSWLYFFSPTFFVHSGNREHWGKKLLLLSRVSCLLSGLSACVPCPPSSLACLSSPPRLSCLRMHVCVCVCVFVCVCAWAGCLGKPLTQLREEMSNRPIIVCKCVCVCMCVCLCMCVCASVMCILKEAPVPCDRQSCCVYLTPLTSGGFLVCVRCCSPRPAEIGRHKLLLFLCWCSLIFRGLLHPSRFFQGPTLESVFPSSLLIRPSQHWNCYLNGKCLDFMHFVLISQVSEFKLRKIDNRRLITYSFF